MAKAIINFTDVNADTLASTLEVIAEDLRNGDVLIQTLKSEHTMAAGEVSRFGIDATFVMTDEASSVEMLTQLYEDE